MGIKQISVVVLYALVNLGLDYPCWYVSTSSGINDREK